MATSSSYYLNAPSLGSATAVFTDDTLLILAADGFYSDGVISREQVSGVLLPQQTCPSCLSYNCVEGVCTDPGDGSGLYTTLEECELACSPPPPTCSCFRADNVSGEERTISYTTCLGLPANDVPLSPGVPITDCYLISGGISFSGSGVVITSCPEIPCTSQGDCGTCGAP